MAPKMYIETYGCQMNEYESDRTFRTFEQAHGFARTEKIDNADLVLLNTCSIRDKADQKAFSSLGRLRVAKTLRPEMVIAVGGCLVQSQGDEIRRRAPFVDVVFGTHQWEKLPTLVEKARKERQQIVDVDMYGWNKYKFLPYRSAIGVHPVSEFVTIQNGCDKFCTFCLVPFTRGREVSRSPEEIFDEVKLLSEKGTKEVTLLGQNVNAYGRDRSGQIGFGELLDRVAEVPELKRIRFMTSHPSEMSDELVERLADNPKICRHLHLPLQSGSDRVLDKMNRQYTLREFRKRVESLRKAMPDLTLTTDLIVGFPSETEDDFQSTLNAVNEFEFDDSFSFVYSPRPNTKAAKWVEDFVNADVASERLDRLQALQRAIQTKKNVQTVGKQYEVLVEGASRKNPKELAGKNQHHHTINFEAASDLVGELVQIRILEARHNTLKGERVP
jgi:tRNA-2-methylthio-N6-dimethylallyladenosine synthase